MKKNEPYYYGWLLKKDKPRGNIKKATTYFYDRWTGQLNKNGERFCEVEEFSDRNLIRSEDIWDLNGEQSSRINRLEWIEGKLARIDESNQGKEKVTFFHYDQDLLHREQRFLHQGYQLIKSEELQYEYIYISNVFKLKEIIRAVFRNKEVFAISKLKQIDYDEFGRVAKISLPGKYDDLGRIIENYYDYSLNSEIIKVTKKYLDADTSHGIYYIRTFENEEFVVPTFEQAQKFTINIHGDFEEMGGNKFTYEYDANNNWLKKYDDKRLIAERTLQYYT